MVEGARERAALETALIDLTLERGFGEVTVDAICERAGVGTEEFRARHGSLEAFQIEVIEAVLGRFNQRLDPIRHGSEPWRDRLRATGYELYRLFVEDESAGRFLVFAVRTGSEQAVLIFGREVEKMVMLVDEGRGEMEDPEAVGRSTADQIAGGFFNHLYVTLSQGPMPPEETIVPNLMYTAVLPYLGEEVASEELSISPPP